MDDFACQDIILCYGHDEMLLATRQRILKKIGVRVDIASTESDYRQKLFGGDVAVVLLCQSLSTEECAGAAAFAKENSPSSKVLLMYTEPGDCDLQNENAEFFSGDGPLALVRTVVQLLSTHTRDQT
jgi:hypothetical protein